MRAKHQFKAPAFSLYAKEFVQDEAVIVMDLDAVGAYIILLCHQWNEGSVPSDVSLLARICRTTPERMQSIWPQVAVKFPPKRGDKTRLANVKLEIVRNEKQKFAAKQSSSGSQGAQKRWTGKANAKNHMDGVAHEGAMGPEWANDSFGIGIGFVNTPLTPLEEGNGAAAPLVLVPPDGSRNPSRTTSRKPYADALEEVARSIHGRHPNALGRRDLSSAGVEKQLGAILRYQRVSVAEAEAYLRRIDGNHAAACRSEGWTKSGGEFAKALRGWLAPREERYLVESTAPVQQATVRLMA
jgi:uncharacterized protein YdaU (DUF1376 family)